MVATAMVNLLPDDDSGDCDRQLEQRGTVLNKLGVRSVAEHGRTQDAVYL